MFAAMHWIRYELAASTNIGPTPAGTVKTGGNPLFNISTSLASFSLPFLLGVLALVVDLTVIALPEPYPAGQRTGPLGRITHEGRTAISADTWDYLSA